MTRQANDGFRTDLQALIPSLRAFTRYLTASFERGEDLAQDTLCRALDKRDQFQPGTNLKAWLFTIARNIFYSETRRSWRWTELDDVSANRLVDDRGDFTKTLELDDLRRAMNMLPDSQREALILVGAGGLSYEEAAAIMGVKVGTVKSRVSRARDSVALIVEEGRIIADEVLPSAAMAAISMDLGRYGGGRLPQA